MKNPFLNVKEQLFDISKKAFIVVLIVGLFSGSAYFGVKLWFKYVSDLPAEVNAAIISGIFGLVTVFSSMGFTAYLNHQSQKITLRDELIKKRIEVSQELYVHCFDVYHSLFQFIYSPMPERLERLQEKCENTKLFLRRNQFYLSKPLFGWSSLFVTNCEMLSIAAKSGVFSYPIKPNQKIVSREQYLDEFKKQFFDPLIKQFYKELGLKSLEKEIQKIYQEY